MDELKWPLCHEELSHGKEICNACLTTATFLAGSPRLNFASGDLSFWSAEGTAFLQQPVRGDRFTTSQARPGLITIGGDYWDGPHPVGNKGEYWLSTEDHLTGTLLSDEFIIAQEASWLSFLIGGTNNISAHTVSLLIKATPTNTKALAQNYPAISLNGKGLFYQVFVATGHDSEIMRRVSFDAQPFAGEHACIHVCDNAPTGHLNVDDFQFTAEPLPTQPGENAGDANAEIWGFADIHSHPMANLAFGGEIFWGQTEGSIEAALAWCTPEHGLDGTGKGSIVGDILMTFFEATGYGLGLGHSVGGYPQFDGWPRFTSLIHQQMYVDWIRRAYDGGLRLLVAHAVNNELLASEYNGKPPYDDVTAVETQIAAMKILAANQSSWMQIAYSSAEARSIIQQNKLAIVLGVEVDSIGNWKDASTVTQADVTSYLNHLHDLGVRHLFPVHQANNVLSGAAIYNDIFSLTNFYLHKNYFQVEDGSPQDIEFRLEVDPGAAPVLARVQMGYNPPESEYAQHNKGHVNAAGLSALGSYFIQTMMHLGMIIEIDHMSQKSVEATLTLAEQNNYPVVAGHTFFRELAWRWQADTQCIHKCASEQSKTATQVERISKLGGMVAPLANQVDIRNVGDVIPSLAGKIPVDSTGSAATWGSAYLYAVEKMGGRGIAIGTDTNGLAKFSSPRFGLNASYYLDYNVAGWDIDPARKPLRAQQVNAQKNGVKYDKPLLDARHYRFEGILEGNVYDETDRNIWQAVGLYYAGLNPWTNSSIPDINDDVVNFARGLFATSASQLLQPGLFTGNAPYEQRAAYLVKNGQTPGSSDSQVTQMLYPKVLAIWQRWQAMQGNNTPLTRSYAGQRDFDINLDGVAHYGMLPDFLQDLKNVGLTDTDLAPFFRSAEDYIQMWAKCEARSQSL